VEGNRRFAGSSSRRATTSALNRRDYWLDHWHIAIHEKGAHFVWHVLTRDWDKKIFRPTPYKLPVLLVRYGAEKVALDVFAKWAKTANYAEYNKINPPGPGYGKRTYKRMKEAGTALFNNQLENNAGPGDGKDDGDFLNTAENGANELPGGMMSGMPNGGSKCH
jgi:hypothetical protein